MSDELTHPFQLSEPPETLETLLPSYPSGVAVPTDKLKAARKWDRKRTVTNLSHESLFLISHVYLWHVRFHSRETLWAVSTMLMEFRNMSPTTLSSHVDRDLHERNGDWMLPVGHVRFVGCCGRLNLLEFDVYLWIDENGWWYF